MHMYAHTHTCEKNACTPLHTNVRTHVCTHTHTHGHTQTHTHDTHVPTHTHKAFNYTVKLIPQTRSHHFIPVHCKWNQWTHLRRTMFRTPMEQIVTILYLVLSPEMTPTHTATTTETRNTKVTPPACNQCLGIEEESLILLVCTCCTTRVWAGKNVPYSLVSKQRHGRSTSVHSLTWVWHQTHL